MDRNMEEQPQHETPRRMRSLKVPRWLAWTAGILAISLVALFLISYLLDGTLRRSMESKLNATVKGYTFRIQKMHLQLVGFSLTIKGLEVLQAAHPETPVATFPLIKAEVLLPALMFGKLVAEFRLERPVIDVNLQQLRSEAEREEPVSKRGWQQTITAIYPLKIDTIRIVDGAMTYIDEDPSKPLRLSRINLKARNIRNVRTREGLYPSSFHLDMVIFDTGRGVLDGEGNFLQEPFPGFKAELKLESVPLKVAAPVAAKAGIEISGGVLDAAGRGEASPKIRDFAITDLSIRDAVIDYVRRPDGAAGKKTKEKAKEKAKAAAGKAAKESQPPELTLAIDRTRFSNCTFGFVNRAASHPYRLFFDRIDLALTDYSNRSAEKTAHATLRGRFMGQGAMSAKASFHPGKGGLFLDSSLQIAETPLETMNDLFRSHGKFDVSEGTFALNAVIGIREGALSGYVQPYFRKMKIYDWRKDIKKQPLRQLYQLTMDRLAALFKNTKRDEITVKAELSGRVDDPKTSMVKVVWSLVRDAFLKAVLPIFPQQPFRGEKPAG